ncbi:MAG: hypothetical protein KBT39_05170 [Bacteroidales bacterium]|nr:hypothetical protein [Bacteroidales bacterium]
MSSSASRASEADVLLGAYADKYRQEGWEAAAAQYQPQLDAKDRKIAELEAQLAKMQSSSATTTRHLQPSRNYEYNAACFPKPNAETILEALIELANSKREGGKYIVNTKTDWYMVWKVLHYFKLYTGNEYDFVDVVNDCVLPYFPDASRQKALSVKSDNFKGIKYNNPMKEVAVANWRRELEKEQETRAENPTQHGTLALDRGINIKVKLQQLLQARGVESYNYEK